jgi:hypothetical protein
MSEHLTLTPDELLTTTRAVRKRLDFTRPVERTVGRKTWIECSAHRGASGCPPS